MSGWVTVTGPPASICALNFGTTEPFEASTLPNRTEIRRIGGLPLQAGTASSRSSAWQYISAKRLVSAQHRHRLDRLVGRDHHHGVGAGRERGVGDIDRAEDVGLDALVPVALQDRHVLQRRGVKHDVRLELGHQPHDAVAIADVGDPPVDRGRRPAAAASASVHGMQRRLGILDHQQPAPRRKSRRARISPIRSSPPPPVTTTALLLTNASSLP